MAAVDEDLVAELLLEMSAATPSDAPAKAPAGPPLPVGAAVTLIGLSTVVLNGLPGVVVRCPDPPSDRLHVRLHAGGRDGGRTVRVRRRHVRPAAAAAPLPPPPLHLGLASGVAVKRDGFFYAFGNTPPLYVLPGVPTDADARVALLGSGDLRAPLYSIYRDAAAAAPPRSAAPPRRRLEFLVNDANPYVAARNVVLLHLALDAAVPADTLFAVWFSLALPPAAAGALRAALAELTGPAADAALRRLGVSFHAAGERQAVAAVWHDWAGWAPCCGALRAARRVVLEDRFPDPLREMARGHATLLLMAVSLGRSDFPTRAATAEVEQYFETGSVPPLAAAAAAAAGAATPAGRAKAKARPPREAANVTLLRSPTTWDLHYGAVPFTAFPLFHASYDARRPLAVACVAQLASWAAALRATDGGVRWTFSVADCLSLCGALPRGSPYAVVASSNLMDHVGLLPLLQAARGLVPPGGCLLTQSLLGSTFADSSVELLRVHTGTDPAHWPGVLGWRCLGYEGALAPEHSAFQLDPPDWMAACPPSQRDAGAVVRSEAAFVWTPAGACAIPGRSGPAHADVVSRFRVAARPSPLGPLMALNGPFRSHLLSLLPALLACPDARALLCAARDWEVRDILEGVVHGSRLVEAAVRVPAGRLDFGRAAQVPLGVVLSKGTRLVLYTGLSVTWEAADGGGAAGDGGWWVARWLLHPARLSRGTRILLVRHLAPQALPVLATFSVDDVALRRVPAARVAAWADRYAPPPLAADDAVFFAGGGGVKDLPSHWDVHLPSLPAAWRKAAGAGERLAVSCVADEPNAVRVEVGAAFASAVVLSLPGPVAPESPLPGERTTRLAVVVGSTDGSAVVCIPKARYAFDTLAPAEYVHQDTRVWVPSTVAAPAIALYTGMQLSAQERVSRRLPLQQVPPLTAAKESIALILLHPHAPVIRLAVEGPDTRPGGTVCAVLLPRGLRVEHRTGVPAADVAVCLGQHLRAVLPFVRSLGALDGDLTIRTSAAEYAVLGRAFCLMAGRAKAWRADSGWATGGRVAVPPPLRPYFVPVLVQPLFGPLTPQFIAELVRE